MNKNYIHYGLILDLSSCSIYDLYLKCVELLKDFDAKRYEKESKSNIYVFVSSYKKPEVAHEKMFFFLLKKRTDSLIKHLNKYTPPFTYLGYCYYQPSRFGVWLDMSKINFAEKMGWVIQGDLALFKKKKRDKVKFFLNCDSHGKFTIYDVRKKIEKILEI